VIVSPASENIRLVLFVDLNPGLCFVKHACNYNKLKNLRNTGPGLTGSTHDFFKWNQYVQGMTQTEEDRFWVEGIKPDSLIFKGITDHHTF
jgi:hypothetical protein